MSRAILLGWIVFLALVSCSPVRYNYFFDRQSKAAPQVVLVDLPMEASSYESVRPSEPALEASANVRTSHSSPMAPSIRHTQKRVVAGTPTGVGNLLPAERKNDHIDKDLMRSVIFVAAGIFALLVGSTIFWVLGSLSVVIGIIFGIKWLVRQ
jgi:hypothetical protein